MNGRAVCGGTALHAVFTKCGYLFAPATPPSFDSEITLSVVRLLLDSGVDPLATDRSGHNAIHYAFLSQEFSSMNEIVGRIFP